MEVTKWLKPSISVDIRCLVWEISRLVWEISRGAEVQRGYEWVNAAGETLVDFEYDNPAGGG
jgi:hypothetical protein